MDDKLLDVKQVAEFLGFQPATVRDFVRKKKIPFYKIGGAIRFRKSELIEWVTERKVS